MCAFEKTKHGRVGGEWEKKKERKGRREENRHNTT